VRANTSNIKNGLAKVLILSLSCFFHLSSRTPVHGERQSLTTKQRKHPVCLLLTSPLWTLVHLIKNLALKLAQSASC